jgi:hypothetical protein
LDLELKERDYVNKIIRLETCIAELPAVRTMEQTMVSRREQAKSGVSDRSKFCEVMVKTYYELFGISSLKDIWKKHKEILGEWMLH